MAGFGPTTLIDYATLQEAFEHQKLLLGAGKIGLGGNYFLRYTENMGIDAEGLLTWSVEYAESNMPAELTPVEVRGLVVGAFTRAFTLGILLGRKEGP